MRSTSQCLFNSKRILRLAVIVLITVNISIVILDIWQHNGSYLPNPIRNLLNITREDNIGTWFSTSQTLAVAVILWIIFSRVRYEKGPTKSKLAWGIAAGFFTYASLDDGSKLHERLGSLVDLSSFFPSYPWQVLFVPVFIVIGFLILYIVVKEMKNKSAKSAIVFGLLLSAVSAVGLDFIEGVPQYSNLTFANLFSENHPHARHYIKTIEECIEMLGITMFLAGFGRHLMWTYSEWLIKFELTDSRRD